MNRNEILVMEELYKLNCTSELKATTISTLAKSIQISYYSVRNIVKSLVMAEYCGTGFKKGRSETYYLTGKGIEKVKTLKEENV